MRKRRHVAVIVVAFAGFLTASAQVNVDRYAWESPQMTGVPQSGSEVDILREEISAILRAGHLAPLRIHYADEYYNGYFMYLEPGRIITTLARAYPYVTSAQQDSIRAYVTAELADTRFAPWGTSPMPVDVGARRELHLMDRVWNPYKAQTNLPSIHTIYGLWLFGYRTGDWSFLQPNWDKIKNIYNTRKPEGFLYGTMCAHIAMARMAHRMNDAATRTAALNALQTALNDGRDFSAIEAHAGKGVPSGDWWKYMYPARYEARNDGLLWHGWVFLGHLSPEIGRYMQDHVAGATIARYNEGIAMFPLWWLLQSPYFCRWTGDEGIGLATEIFGMMAPLERWVVQTGTKMRDRVRSAPTGKGDCYWIEALVDAIEVQGSLAWVDVRGTSVAAPGRPDLLSPADRATGVSSTASFTWSSPGPGYSYRFQLSEDSLFSLRIKDSIAAGMTGITVSGLSTGKVHYWRVQTLAADASSDWSTVRRFTTTGVTGLGPDVAGIVTLSLMQNYPNPFNPSTTIAYEVPAREFVSLEVWNVLGQRVRGLIAREHGPGSYRAVWNGDTDGGAHAASGAYVCVLRTGGTVRTIRMLMIR